MRTPKPFDVVKFMRDCCTKVLVDRTWCVTHRVNGRLLKSIASPNDSRRDFFLIKLKDTSLIQRYMVAIREPSLLSKGLTNSIMAYFQSMEEAESYLEGK